ncbi:hypothetical protein CCHR01_17845 [Colletotrichum chrysophilum]|uniref:Uncharacterized protein n=1 Tax=Colletotrichum chrysophilum TaxID=1836956 RepID=A0AAD9A1E0_9PEZI|nr:hypothetical protein CCHR01_17845 [Colletotrichum chrysophilum]
MSELPRHLDFGAALTDGWTEAELNRAIISKFNLRLRPFILEQTPPPQRSQSYGDDTVRSPSATSDLGSRPTGGNAEPRNGTRQLVQESSPAALTSWMGWPGRIAASLIPGRSRVELRARLKISFKMGCQKAMYKLH